MEQRCAWTDARLDDRFDRIDHELAELRIDLRELRGEVSSLRAEFRAGMLRINVSLWVATIGLFATIIARGA
jgi:hypothetical protein